MPFERRARRSVHRVGVAAALLAATSALLLCAAPAQAAQLYCDRDPSAALTGAEHRVLAGDPPLPDGVRQRALTVGGVTTRVLEAGPGAADEAVVLVHGNPGSARDFDGLLTTAGRHGRALAFDVPGLGRADDRPGLDYTTAGAARFIGAVVDALGVRRVHLVLHDLGGIWGLEWATGRLGAVRSVTLIDTGVLIGYLGHPLGLSWTLPVLGEAEMATLTREQFKGVLGLQDPLPERFLDRMYDDFDLATRCAVLAYYRSLGLGDAIGRRQAPVLRGADLPALVVWGARDAFVPVDVASRQVQAFPSARVEVIAGAGHWPQLDTPGRVGQLVDGFLATRMRAPRLVVAPLTARAGARRLSMRVRVDGAPVAGGVRLSVLRRGWTIGTSGRGRTVDRVARRIAIVLRQPLRRGARYVLRAQSAELAAQTRAIRAR
jgi:pimeloyl-ACP methyl ester carboxylesterase